MPVNYRSRKARLSALSAQLRAEGKSWAEIATVIAAAERESPLVAMRIAHGLSQTEAAERLSALYPHEPTVTFKMLSYWEVWPASTGHQPSLKILGKLARLYHCQVSDLVDDAMLARLSGADVPARSQPPVTRSVPVLLEAGSGQAAEQVVIPTGLQLPDELALAVQQCLLPLTSAHPEATMSARQRDVVFGQLVTFLRGWAHTMKRREVLQLFGWAASAATAVPAGLTLDPSEQERVARAIEVPSRVDAGVIDHIDEVLWHCIRQDDARGPQAVLDTLLAQRQLTQVMLSDAAPSLRPRLLSVYSNLSRYTGWLCFDLGDYDSAWYYYETARRAAHEARDTALGAMVLINMSHTATWQHQPRTGIDHAIAAQGWATRTDDVLLQAYAADVAARAYAADGQYNACMAELDTAEAGLAASSGQPSIIHFYDAGLLASIRGTCLLQLGQPADAATATTQSLTLLDPTFVRNLAMTKADLASCMTQFGDIDQACQLLGDAALLAGRNRSARLLAQIRDGRTTLQPWHDTKPVAELDDLLTTCQLV